MDKSHEPATDPKRIWDIMLKLNWSCLDCDFVPNIWATTPIPSYLRQVLLARKADVRLTPGQELAKARAQPPLAEERCGGQRAFASRRGEWQRPCGGSIATWSVVSTLSTFLGRKGGMYSPVVAAVVFRFSGEALDLATCSSSMRWNALSYTFLASIVLVCIGQFMSFGTEPFWNIM